jgi:hypothetical protein
MDQKEKRQLQTQLIKMGLAGLDTRGLPTGELIQQIAQMVNQWKGAENRMGEWVDRHKFLRDLLNECEPAQRSDMFDTLTPHLSFKPLPLSTYEAMIQEKAGRMVSQRKMRVEGNAPKPIEIGGTRYAAAPRSHATHAVATLTCHRCHKVEKFIADTPVSAMIEGRRAGWIREPGENKEICAECAAALAATVVRLSSTESLPVYDRRAHKIDA